MAGPSEAEPIANEELPPTDSGEIPEEVRTALGFTAGTSDKYVPQPSAEAIVADQIAMIRDFHVRVRRKANNIKLRKREDEDDQNWMPPNQLEQQSQPHNNQPSPRG